MRTTNWGVQPSRAFLELHTTHTFSVVTRNSTSICSHVRQFFLSLLMKLDQGRSLKSFKSSISRSLESFNKFARHSKVVNDLSVQPSRPYNPLFQESRSRQVAQRSLRSFNSHQSCFTEHFFFPSPGPLRRTGRSKTSQLRLRIRKFKHTREPTRFLLFLPTFPHFSLEHGENERTSPHICQR